MITIRVFSLLQVRDASLNSAATNVFDFIKKTTSWFCSLQVNKMDQKMDTVLQMLNLVLKQGQMHRMASASAAAAATASAGGGDSGGKREDVV